MLHDKLIAENFVHHIKNDHSSQNTPTKKLDMYKSYGLPSEQEKLRLEEYQALDLSRRYETGGNSSRKTPQLCENDNIKSSIKTSPSTTSTGIADSASSSTPGKILAASIQKLYAHHSMISSSTPTNFPTSSSSSQNQLFNNSQGFPLYPMYYPQIKRERDLSPQSQENFMKTNEQLPNFSQAYHHNLFHSFNLMKGVSLPEHVLPDIKSSPPTTPINISPKPSAKPEILEDKLSENGSIPGSPSSSSATYYSKLQKATSLLAVDQQNQQQQVKPTRPFKAYPRDPTVIAANFAATDSLYDNSKVERYSEYRKRILEQIRSANGGERTVSNPKMRRTINRTYCPGRSDESNSDNQMNNSESEDRTGDSDNDSMAASIVIDTNSDADKMNSNNNNNNNEVLNKNDGSSGVKDAAYFERRRKNNAAAKKSRDRRRIKEDEIAIRAAYLERQNIELLCQLDALKSQLDTITKSNESRLAGR